METLREGVEPASWTLSDSVVDRLFDRCLQRIISRSYRRAWKVALLIAVTWGPIFLFSLVEKRAFQGAVDVPLLMDPTLCARFLFVLPLLELGRFVVAISLAVQSRHFIEARLVRSSDHERFLQALTDAVRMQTSNVAEVVVVGLALTVSLLTRFGVSVRDQTSWAHDGASCTVAGWWYALVALPILMYYLLRWGYVYGLWAWFLIRVSRLQLELTPTHPDHAGGLGFLGWGLAGFSTILTAVSAVFSAGFAYEILHRNKSLDSLKYHVIVFVVATLIVIYAPLLTFARRLSRCRYLGLLDYSALVLRHDRAFDEKWIARPAAETQGELLGSADIQSLADIGTVYQHVYEMRLIPFDAKAFAVLVTAILLPLLPLIASVIPLNEIFAKLLELAA